MPRWAVAAAAAVAFVAPVLGMIDVSFPGRLLIALAFFLLVPGVAVLAWMRLPSILATWSLAVALSLSANILATMLQVLTGWWAPLVGISVLAAGSLVVSAIWWDRRTPVVAA